MKYLILILRIAIGILFIYSGLMKANDPMGLVYKMNEFFDAMNMGFMISLSFAFSVFMIALEVVTGVAVLIGFSYSFFSTMLLLLNLFFLFITGFALFSGKVKECGCFGTCVKISNTATFAKDIALTAVSIFLFATRFRVVGMFEARLNRLIFLGGIVLVVGTEWYTLTHLPIYDCMPYKPGSNIWAELQPGADYKPPVVKSVFIYEKNGVKKEFTEDNYPWQDSTWKFVDRKDKIISDAVGEPEAHDFVLTDDQGSDDTRDVLNAKGYTFFWFVRELDQAHMNKIDRLRNLADKAAELHIPFYLLCSNDMAQSKDFLKRIGVNAKIFTLDGTASRTAMRTNPGLMLLKDGIVQKKWSYMDYPKDMAMNGDKLDVVEK